MTLKEEMLRAELAWVRRIIARWQQEEKRVIEQIQEVCDHEWRWAQVAGEGRVCDKCGAVDYEGD